MDEITRNNFDYIESRVATTNPSFVPKVWKDGDILTSAEFNRIEQGIANSNILDNIDLKNYIYNILKLKGITLDVGYTLNDMVKAVSMLGRYEYRPLPVNEENPDIRINQPNGSIRLLYKDIAPCKASIWVKTKDNSQYTVSWGEGVEESFNSNTISNHTFTKGGGTNVHPSYTVFVVTVKGNLSEFKIENNAEGLIWFCGKNIDLDGIYEMFKGNKSSLSRIEFIGTDTLRGNYNPITNRFNAFEGCGKIKEFIGLISINMSGVSTLIYMFQNCNSLTSLPTILDLSSSTNTSNMFQNCNSLTSLPTILDLSSSTNTSNMFYNCNSLTNLPTILDLSSSTNTNGMFYNCNSLTNLPTILDLSSSTNTSNMFYNCNSLTNLPTILDLSSSTNTNDMFYNCNSLTNLPTILDLSSSTNTSGMFQSCSSLTSLPTILDLSSSTNTSYMFNGCNSLTSLPTILDLSSSTNTNGMFQNCNSLTSLPTILDLSSSTNTNGMFYNCNSLTNLPTILDLSSSTNTSYMFQNCSSDRLKRICCINVKANQWDILVNSVPSAKVGGGNVFIQNNITESARTILTNKNWTVENYVPQP